MNCRASLLLLCVIIGFASCISTSNMKSIEIEMMKPALITLSEKMDTIAIFNRTYYQSDTYSYSNENSHKVINDTTIHYSDLSNQCVDALTKELMKEGYFIKIINCRDSINYLFTIDTLINYPKLHKEIGADAFILLDYFKLRECFADNVSGYSYFLSNIIDQFPEFDKSTKVESIDADLLWTVSIEGDTSLYAYKQHPKNLCYGNSVYPDFFGNDFNHKILLKNTAEYLGKSFAPKLIPSWEKVNRLYYRSSNENMRIGEKYLLDNDWLKAAAIYKGETKSKNHNIAAKATYNMALICEMEGNIDAANDWVDRSSSAYKIENQEHLFHCTQYSTILEKRKKEIELLNKQVRNDAEY